MNPERYKKSLKQVAALVASADLTIQNIRSDGPHVKDRKHSLKHTKGVRSRCLQSSECKNESALEEILQRKLSQS